MAEKMVRDDCKAAVQKLLRDVGRPMDEDTITKIIMSYHPDFTRRDVHVALIMLESERQVKSVYKTEFVAC